MPKDAATVAIRATRRRTIGRKLWHRPSLLGLALLESGHRDQMCQVSSSKCGLVDPFI
jgi:hypothetical protein